MISPEESASCFSLAVAGAPNKEIAQVKGLDEAEVRRAIEQEVADRVDPDDFDSLRDALDYIRYDRLQRGMWSSASRGGIQESRQVLALIDKRNALRKTSKRGRSLSKSVKDMLHSNDVNINESEEEQYE